MSIFVTGIMQREFLKVDANKSLTEVRQVMEEKGTRIAAVYHGAAYLGLIGLEDITEAFAIQTFVRRHERLKPAPAHV